MVVSERLAAVIPEIAIDMRKLTPAQKLVLRLLAAHPVVMLRSTAGYDQADREFWKALPGAAPGTFHSLVTRGLATCKHYTLYSLTDSGRVEVANLRSEEKA